MEELSNTSSVSPKDEPVLEEFDYDAEIHDWSIVPSISGGSIVCGAIFNDKAKRFRDGQRIRTSKVVSVNNGKVTTLNTRYLLVNV
jgi:hypothetical protein